MSSGKLPKLIVILGPTASGKSSLAQKIAMKYKAELISADSRQIYKEMDIGTAKISACDTTQHKASRHLNNASQRVAINHNIHLIDIVKPSQSFSLAQYQRKAIAKIRSVNKKNKLPVLVGGTLILKLLVLSKLKIRAASSEP